MPFVRPPLPPAEPGFQTCEGPVQLFSYRGRDICASCKGHHMAQAAAYLIDHVISPVPVHRWMISMPKRVRGFLADRAAAVAALTMIILNDGERSPCAAAGVTSIADAPTVAHPRLGGIAFLHRFGLAFSHHVHLNACVTDGAFVPAADGSVCDSPPACLLARPIT